MTDSEKKQYKVVLESMTLEKKKLHTIVCPRFVRCRGYAADAAQLDELFGKGTEWLHICASGFARTRRILQGVVEAEGC